MHIELNIRFTSSDFLARVGGIVSFLFLEGACTCGGLCSLGWAVMACRLLAGWLALAQG